MLLTVLLAVALLSMLFTAIRREMQIRDKIETYDGTHRQAAKSDKSNRHAPDGRHHSKSHSGERHQP